MMMAKIKATFESLKQIGVLENASTYDKVINKVAVVERRVFEEGVLKVYVLSWDLKKQEFTD